MDLHQVGQSRLIQLPGECSRKARLNVLGRHRMSRVVEDPKDFVDSFVNIGAHRTTVHLAYENRDICGTVGIRQNWSRWIEAPAVSPI